MASPQCRGELLHGHPEIRKTTFNPLSQMGPLSKGRRGNTNALMYQVKKKKKETITKSRQIQYLLRSLQCSL